MGKEDSETGLAPGLGKSALSPGVGISSLMERSDDIEEGSGREVRSLTDSPSFGEWRSCSDEVEEEDDGGSSCLILPEESL